MKRMRHGHKARWAAVVTAFAAIAGCTLLTPLDGLSGGKRTPDGGTSDASGGHGGTGGQSAGGQGPAGGHEPSGGHDAAGGGGGNGCAAGYAKAVLADHPLAYYPLDDTTSKARDLSDGHHDGIYGPEVTRRQPGLLGEACDRSAGFPGGPVAPPKSIAVTKASRLEPTTAITMEAWIRMSVIPVGDDNNPAILAYGDDGATGARYTMDIDADGPYLNVYVTAASQDPNGYTGIGLHSVTVLTANTIYYVVTTYDAGRFSLYLDGVLDQTAESSLPGAAIVGYPPQAGLYIGGDPPFTARPAFDGTIEHLAIYGTALTPDHIAKHFQAAGH